MLFGVRVFVVVPAYCEAPRIGKVLRGMPAFVDQVVVVDDASPDATSERAAGERDARVTVLGHDRNRGVGAAIATGYRHALGLAGGERDAIVVMAGDGQMDPRDLPALIEPLARGTAQYVKGNRFVWPGVREIMPPLRRWVGLLFSRLTARATGLALDDSQCGYTALARSACEALDLEALWPRYGYPNDLLGQLATRGIVVAEVPVRPVYEGAPSGLRPWHALRIAWLIARAGARRVREERRQRANLRRSASVTTAGA